MSRTNNGALVVNFPGDYVVWTEPMAQMLNGANQMVNELPGIKEKQLWLTGTLSPGHERKLRAGAGKFVIAPRPSYLAGWRPIRITRGPTKDCRRGL